MAPRQKKARVQRHGGDMVYPGIRTEFGVTEQRTRKEKWQEMCYESGEIQPEKVLRGQMRSWKGVS